MTMHEGRLLTGSPNTGQVNHAILFAEDEFAAIGVDFLADSFTAEVAQR